MKLIPTEIEATKTFFSTLFARRIPNVILFKDRDFQVFTTVTLENISRDFLEINDVVHTVFIDKNKTKYFSTILWEDLLLPLKNHDCFLLGIKLMTFINKCRKEKKQTLELKIINNKIFAISEESRFECGYILSGLNAEKFFNLAISEKPDKIFLTEEISLANIDNSKLSFLKISSRDLAFNIAVVNGYNTINKKIICDDSKITFLAQRDQQLFRYIIKSITPTVRVFTYLPKNIFVAFKDIPKEKRLMVSGSRTFNDRELLFKELDKLDFDILVSGGAKGADRLAEDYAESHNKKIEQYLPDWDTHGKKAGILRNVEMLKNCDRFIAFWENKSPGTKHAIETARKNKDRFKFIKIINVGGNNV